MAYLKFRPVYLLQFALFGAFAKLRKQLLASPGLSVCLSIRPPSVCVCMYVGLQVRMEQLGSIR